MLPYASLLDCYRLTPVQILHNIRDEQWSQQCIRDGGKKAKTCWKINVMCIGSEVVMTQINAIGNTTQYDSTMQYL
jgi:hypothetical protein